MWYASVNSKSEHPPSMQPLGFCTYFQPGSDGFVPLESPGDCPGVGPIIKVPSCQLMPHEGIFQLENGARKNLKAEKFQVKMLLYLLISQLQIPDLISVLSTIITWLQEFQFILRINFPEAVANLIRNSWNRCTNATSRSTSFITLSWS